MQPCDEVRALSHDEIVPQGQPRRLVLMSAMLTTRLHVDLQRVSSAICSLG
jgi:hypothetical protein